MGLNSYRQKLDKNSTLVKGFRKEAEQELEARMEKWGINPVRSSLSAFTTATNIWRMAICIIHELISFCSSLFDTISLCSVCIYFMQLLGVQDL